MATTKIWAVKDNLKRLADYARNPEKTVIDDDLWAVLHYSMNTKKTRYDEKLMFVSGIGCSEKSAYSDMIAVKKHFGKTGGNLAYHAYQSFKPGEITPQECHEIGVDLARRLWGSRFQVLVSTHLDKGHLHNHFVINSVSYTDGKRFDCSERTYYQMRRVSDEICKSRSLSVIEKPKGHTPRTLYFAEKRGEPTRYNLMREAMDTAAGMSKTMEQFKAALLKKGYVYDDDPRHKYPTIRSVNSKKTTRVYHLGEEYEPEKLVQRMRLNPSLVQRQWYDFMYPKKPKYVPKQERKVYCLKGSLRNVKPRSGLQAVFLIFGYMLGVYPARQENQRRKPLSPEMREACRFLDRFSEQVQLMGRHHRRTEDDVVTFISATESKVEELSHRRRRLYDRVSRAETEDEKAAVRSEYEGFTAQISALRKDLRTAKRIVSDLPKMKDGIAAEQNMRSLQREIEQTQRNKSMRKERNFER